jgi:hypothetical protein
MPGIARIVALGASNLTRGFHTVVSTARAVWGPEVQVLAALGHGRSYGAASRVLFRVLPGILESGLWHALEALPAVPTRALVTDVGNDILYDYSPEQILLWISEVINRLQRLTDDIVLTDLPLKSIQRLSESKFLIFRSILFPSSRLSLAEVMKKVEQVNAGLAGLAAERTLKLLHLNPSWYGIDPIHIRWSLCRSAWQEILNAPSTSGSARGSLFEGLRLYFMAPERRRIFGVEQFTPQPGVSLSKGSRIWLY